MSRPDVPMAIVTIKLDGKPLPAELAARSLGATVEFTDQKLPKVTLPFSNTDLAITDHDLLNMAKHVSVQWGYLGGERSKEYRATVKKITGFKVIKLLAYDAEGTKLTGTGTPKVWTNLKYSDIARQIAEKHGLKADVEDSGIAKEQVNQSAQTDLAFLQGLGEEIGFECYIEGGVLHFHKRRYGAKPAVALHYYNGMYGDVIDFNPAEETLNEADEATATGMDPMTKDPIVTKADNETTERDALGQGTYMIDWLTGAWDKLTGAVGKQVPTTAPTASEAKTQADAKFRQAEEDSIKATVQTVGKPGLVAGMLVTVTGVGKRWSGNWYIAQVTHELSGKYTCTLELERNATNDAKHATGGTANTQKPDGAATAGQPATVIISGSTGQVVK